MTNRLVSVDDDFALPTPVREALADSDEIKNVAATELADPSSATRVAGDAVWGTLRTVDLAKFLLPGEAMPNDGSDASVLIQRAVDAVSAALAFTGPRAIVVPSGDFRINTSVVWASGVGFIGAGRGNTRILPYGTAVFGFLPTSWTDGDTIDDCVFKDLTIDCINQSNTPNNVGTKGISLRFMVRGQFENVTIRDSWATAFGCDFLQDTTFINCISIRSGRGVTGFNSFGAGFGIGTGNYARESVSFINCMAIDSHSAGFFIERLLSIPTPNEARGFSIIGCTATGGYNGLRDAGANGVIVSASHFLDNSNAGIHIEGYPTNGRHGGSNGIVSACVVRGNGTGVLIGNAATGGYTFDDNEITDNTLAGVSAVTGDQIGAGWRWNGNRIERNGAGGIILGCALAGRPQITNNIIRENGAGDGIQIAGDCYEPKITGNTIQGHIGAGVNFSDETKFLTDPYVQQNIITENSAGAILNSKVTNDSSMIANNRTSASFATITNEFTTPSYEVDVSLVAALSRFNAPVQMTDGGRFGSNYARLTVNAAGSASARIARVSGSLSGTRTLSTYVKAPVASIIRPFAVGYWNSNASQRTWNRGGIRATGDWQRVSITVTLPSTGSRIDFDVALDNATAGMNLDVDGTNQTAGTVLWPYIDGDQPNCAWTGTPGASTSVWTVGVVPSPSLSDLLGIATGGETPIVSQLGATIGTGLSISMAQPLTLYTVVTGTPTASMRSALRTGTSADRFAAGRNGGNTAWVAVSNDSSSTGVAAQTTAAATEQVVAAVRDASGITSHVRGLATVAAAIASYEAVTATRIVNDPGVAHTLVYTGAHDDAKRNAVMDVLANWYGIA